MKLSWNGEVEGSTIENNGEEVIEYNANTVIVRDSSVKSIIIEFYGKNLMNGGGCLYINGYPVPLNSTVSMPLEPLVKLNFSLKIPAKSSVLIEKIHVQTKNEQIDLTESCGAEADVLVVTPDYPSTHNLYLCAFAHSRSRYYLDQGLRFQVASISEGRWYQTMYEHEGVSVFCGDYGSLKRLLSKKQYKVIITHFVDLPLFQIYDGYISTEQLIFICHAPEVRFRVLGNVCRPYFTAPLIHSEISEEFDKREAYIKKYAEKDNVEWVFVSEWLMKTGTELNGTEFHNKRVINNLIDEKHFPYFEKKIEDRKKILIIRKFDNTRQHSIDQSILAILELSRRKFFDELTFEVYGDGNYWEELTAPIKQFSNVRLYRTFIPNKDIGEVFRNNGILLIPSRHDSQGVAMGEGASSGLVPVGSCVSAVPDFMNPEENNTLADPESPSELADIIERLFYNPDEFLEISKRMSKETQERCNSEKTVMEEVRLIQEKLGKYVAEPVIETEKIENPILTIVVPAYNVEAFLDKCLFSLCNHRNAGKTEILVINDGSRDSTSSIAHKYATLSKGIVRVIDKENGGHGSTINAGISEAKGIFFRLIDGDDWVDSENLAKQIDLLQNEQADVVLTPSYYEYVDKANLESVVEYSMLNEHAHYYFDDLLYPNYGFGKHGPLLSTATYRTSCLKKANFTISEKKPYVDMEFNALAQRYVKNVTFYDISIYRYLIGREGQTVSRDFWAKKHADHRFIIISILKKIDEMGDYPEWRKNAYVYKRVVAPLIDSQVFMYDQLCLWSEIDCFFDELREWPDALDAGLDYINSVNGDSKKILAKYRKAVLFGRSKPITGQTSKAINIAKKMSNNQRLRRLAKSMIPSQVLNMLKEFLRSR